MKRMSSINGGAAGPSEKSSKTKKPVSQKPKFKPDGISILSYIARPGYEKEITNKGVQIETYFDTSSDISMVPRIAIEKAYHGTSIPYGIEKVALVSGVHEFKTAPLVIGVLTIDGDIHTAQVECMVSEDHDFSLIGNDVLKQLGLKVTFDYKQQKALLQIYNWRTFEEEVAAIYRALGAKVRLHVNLAGMEIDLLIDEITSSKQSVRLAVECKYFSKPVGNLIVNNFVRVIETLKNVRLIDRGVIVSALGFTKDAHLVAEQSGIELLAIEDLRQICTDRGKKVSMSLVQPSTKQSTPQEPAKISVWKTFVSMPFSPELSDVYFLGIREIVAKLGGVCERTDEVQYVGNIIEKVYDSIRDADVIIAEVSIPNPNVYYEIGYAQAMNKQVILLTKNINNTTFDLRGYNHVVYANIVELRQRLEGLLSVLIKI